MQGAVKFVGCSAFGSLNHYRNQFEPPSRFLELAKELKVSMCALPDVYTHGIHLLKQGIFVKKKQ